MINKSAGVQNVFSSVHIERGVVPPYVGLNEKTRWRLHTMY